MINEVSLIRISFIFSIIAFANLFFKQSETLKNITIGVFSSSLVVFGTTLASYLCHELTEEYFIKRDSLDLYFCISMFEKAKSTDDIEEIVCAANYISDTIEKIHKRSINELNYYVIYKTKKSAAYNKLLIELLNSRDLTIEFGYYMKIISQHRLYATQHTHYEAISDNKNVQSYESHLTKRITALKNIINDNMAVIYGVSQWDICKEQIDKKLNVLMEVKM